jgi:hypothetical protein
MKRKKRRKKRKEKRTGFKSDHDGKCFVVHGAKCICDQSIPQNSRFVKVTFHVIIVLNDQQGKLAAIEEDKTFMPPAETFFKCKMKPTAGDSQAGSFRPKWDKTVIKPRSWKNTLTEIFN